MSHKTEVRSCLLSFVLRSSKSEEVSFLSVMVASRLPAEPQQLQSESENGERPKFTLVLAPCSFSAAVLCLLSISPSSLKRKTEKS